MFNFKCIFKGKRLRGDAVSTVDEEGQETNSLLHHEMEQLIEWEQFKAQNRNRLIELGVDPDMADRMT